MQAPSSTRRLTDAMCGMNYVQMMEAIQEGADLDAVNDPRTGIPVWLEICSRLGLDDKALDFARKIIPRVKNPLCPLPLFSYAAFSEQVFGMPNTEVACLVILAGIHKSNGSVRFNLHEIFAYYGDDRNPNHSQRQRIRDYLIILHEQVGAILARPETLYEEKVRQSLTEKDIAYWLSSPLPIGKDLSSYPMPSAQLCHLRLQLVEQRGQWTEGFMALMRARQKKQPERPHLAYMHHTNLLINETTERINGLAREGLIAMPARKYETAVYSR